ncbi:hypothetical protein CAEBREN_05803 [Caenorhabditis brenneri]|uniref:Protein-tyrosine-phosphatase n=1 Tax=Caenorhabditis brenneri TaxID=135651 RepID=G0MN05_CAEBE|nr:hypothetical protein CAEBREN_05803 [Caenorhabditis brenneri]
MSHELASSKTQEENNTTGTSTTTPSSGSTGSSTTGATGGGSALDKLLPPLEENQEEKKSEKTQNCVTWSKNILASAKISTFTQQYRDNKEYTPDVKKEVSEKNADKNRYHHIFCADENRVVLKDRTPANDYIHASWMEMPDGVQFISTQGPIKATVPDFWHMIYTEKCAVIVMLCQYQESDQEKCQKYYSDTSETTFGDYKVKVVEKTTEMFVPVKYTVLQVTKKNSSVKHLVHHFWYYDWHDQVAPLDPVPMIRMYKAVLKKASGKPIVVHCSAGVGRTATFVGIHLGISMIRDNSSTEMPEIMKRLRQMRLGSIQSQLQYVFLIVLILQAFIEEKVIKRDKLFETLLKKYAGITSKVIAAIAKEEEEKRRQQKKEEAREAKEREKEAEWEKIREKEKKEREEKKEKEKEAPALREEKKKEKTLETPSKQPLMRKDPPSRPARRLPNTGEEKTSRECASRYDSSVAERSSNNKQRSVYMKWPLSSKEKRSKHERQKVGGVKKNTTRKTKKKPSSTGH